MSKMSQLHAELSEQAYELGFESIGEAEQAGYGVDWEKHKLIDPQDLAHEAWLKEQKKVIEELKDVRDNCIVEDNLSPFEMVKKINHAVRFIEECHD